MPIGRVECSTFDLLVMLGGSCWGGRKGDCRVSFVWLEDLHGGSKFKLRSRYLRPQATDTGGSLANQDGLQLAVPTPRLVLLKRAWWFLRVCLLNTAGSSDKKKRCTNCPRRSISGMKIVDMLRCFEIKEESHETIVSVTLLGHQRCQSESRTHCELLRTY